MNKFHKTTYSRQHNTNNFGHHARRELWTNHLSQHARNDLEPVEETRQKPLHSLLDKRIKIESSLLFHNKNFNKQAKPIQIVSRKSTNRSQAKFYDTTLTFSSAKNRPQSKQEPRLRQQNVLENRSKDQSCLGERPQTSKGSRKMLQNSRQRHIKNDAGEEQSINVQLLQQNYRNVSSSYSRRSSRQAQLAFQSSIDPEFLALFAN